MPVHYSLSISCGSCLYCITLALAGWLAKAAPSTCVSNVSSWGLYLCHPPIPQNYVSYNRLGLRCNRARKDVSSGNSTVFQRFAEEKYLS